jgi:hypothetical protein
MSERLLATKEVLEYLDIQKGTLDKRIRRGFIKPAEVKRNALNQRINFYAIEDVDQLKTLIKHNRRNHLAPISLPDDTMTTAKAAEYLGVSSRAVHEYARRGFIEPTGKLENTTGKPLIFSTEKIVQFKQSSDFVPMVNKIKGGHLAYPPKLERKTTDEHHPTGCIIHWGEFYRDEKSYAWVPVTCAACKRKFNKRESGMRQTIKNGIFTGCCPDCYQANRRLPKLKSGGRVIRDGYINRHKRTFTEKEWKILEQMNPNGGLYVPEHRAVMALYLGRPLSQNESVHHIDGDKINNQIQNLELLDKADHSKFHGEQLRVEAELRKRVRELEEENSILRKRLKKLS